MKKGLVIGLCGVMLATVLAGCGNSSSKKDSSSATSKSSKVVHKESQANSKKSENSLASLKSESSVSSQLNSSSSSESSQQSSSTTGANQSRDAITKEEQDAGNQPLSWEPIKNAQQTESYMMQKYGDKGWTTSHGTVGMSSPIYFTEQDSSGNAYVVYATGVVTPM